MRRTERHGVQSIKQALARYLERTVRSPESCKNLPLVTRRKEHAQRLVNRLLANLRAITSKMAGLS